jgi:hypothetical protein
VRWRSLEASAPREWERVCLFLPSLHPFWYDSQRSRRARVWQSESVASRDDASGEQTELRWWKSSPGTEGGVDCQIAQCLTQFSLSQASNQDRRGRRDLRALIRPPNRFATGAPHP